MGLDQCAALKSAGEDATPKFIWRKHSKLQVFDVVARTQVVLVIGCSTSDLDT